MSSTLVDSNVLIDLFDEDSDSLDAVEAALDRPPFPISTSAPTLQWLATPC